MPQRQALRRRRLMLLGHLQQQASGELLPAGVLQGGPGVLGWDAASTAAAVAVWQQLLQPLLQDMAYCLLPASTAGAVAQHLASWLAAHGCSQLALLLEQQQAQQPVSPGAPADIPAGACTAKPQQSCTSSPAGVTAATMDKTKRTSPQSQPEHAAGTSNTNAPCCQASSWKSRCCCSSCSPHPQSALTLGALLWGFPQPATEVAYLAFKNRQCLAGIDSLAAAVSLLVMATVLFSMGLQAYVSGGTTTTVNSGPGTSGNSTAEQHSEITAARVCGVVEALLLNAPWAVLLANRGWYEQHRETLVVVLGGAGRVLSALTHGLFSVVSRRDHCAHIRNCAGVLLLACALHYPATQQLRFRPAAMLTLVDTVAVVLYGSFTWGSVWLGLCAGVLAGVVALAVTAEFEFRSRTAFLAGRD